MKYYLWVLGCAMNYADAERIVTALNLLGCQKTDKESEADLIITVACSVRQSAIDRIYGKAKKWQEIKKAGKRLKTILTGCVLEKDLFKMRKVFDYVFDVKQIDNLLEILSPDAGFSGTFLEKKSGEYLEICPTRESFFRAYVPIMTGCNNFCSYCAVPYTRGREKSRLPKEIFGEVKSLVQEGYKEITLLGQNVNSYQYGFVDLLSDIDKIPGEFRVYFYSNHPKDMSEQLIKVIPHLSHFPQYIHLPLQSGSDRILKLMNRHYTQSQYLELVEKIKKVIPNVVLTTDIIVGFPNETEKDFQETKKVMEKVSFDMAYIAQYSPRPGTRSAELDDNVTKSEKVKREKILAGILEKTAFENNLKLKNSTQRVLIDGFKKEKFYGRTEGYKVVEISSGGLGPLKGPAPQLGQFADIEILECSAWKLFGRFR